MYERRTLLSEAQLALARQLWQAGESEATICGAVGMTVDTFRSRRRDQLADLQPRGQAGGNSGRRAPLLSPQEVFARAAAVRTKWSIAERVDRSQGISDPPKFGGNRVETAALGPTRFVRFRDLPAVDADRVDGGNVLE
jgi:hypothetical protein